MRVYLPWLGEFGSELLKWVPRINADKTEKVVCFERGKECLYPTGQPHIVERVSESDRKCSGALIQQTVFDEIRGVYGDAEYIMPTTIGSPGFPEGIFEPDVPEFGFKCDIVVFPRWRHNTKRLNWELWPEFVRWLQAHGYDVFAAGHPDSSFEVECRAAWDYMNPLEASVYAIKNSRLRIGMMTALAVLSLYCGKSPWIMTTENGMKCNTGKDFPNFAYFWFADWKNVGWRTYPFLNNFPKMLPFIEEALCASG